MKHDWEYKKLGEAYILTMGQSPSSDSYNSEGEGLPFFQGCSDFGLIHPTITTFCTAPTKIAQTNDVLMSIRAPIGTLNIADTECCIGRGLASFRANKDGVSKFLYYVLKYSKDKLQSLGTGSTFKAIGKDALKKFIIPVPPLPIQQQIVAELDKVSEIIEKKKQQVKELDNLAQSIFYDMFGDPVENEKGWEVKKLGEICDIIRGGSPRPIEKFLGGDIPWIKIGDATDGESIFLNNTKEHIIKEGLRKTRFIKKGSLIFANCGVSLGFARIITFDGCIHDGWLALMNINDSLNKIFLLKALNFCTLHFRSIAPDGTQPNLNTTIMKNYLQILPPLTLQQSFAQKIEAIEKQKELITASIKEAQLLFDARMDYWFGE